MLMQLIELLRDCVFSLEVGSGLQSRVPQFDSGFRLHKLPISMSNHGVNCVDWRDQRQRFQDPQHLTHCNPVILRTLHAPLKPR